MRAIKVTAVQFELRAEPAFDTFAAHLTASSIGGRRAGRTVDCRSW